MATAFPGEVLEATSFLSGTGASTVIYTVPANKYAYVTINYSNNGVGLGTIIRTAGGQTFVSISNGSVEILGHQSELSANSTQSVSDKQFILGPGDEVFVFAATTYSVTVRQYSQV